MSQRIAAVATLVLAVVLGLPAAASATSPASSGGATAPSSARPRIPDGYSVVSRQPLAAGLTHVVLLRSDPSERVHVAYIAHGARVDLRTVLSNDAIKEDGERLEPTSAMCRRVRCLAAVNGDFFSVEGIPLGAVVADGQLMRSPNGSHHQLMIDPGGKPSAGTFSWRARLVATDLSTIAADAVNVEREANQIVMYTPAFGPSTETNRFGAEMTLEILNPDGPLRVGQTSLVRITGVRRESGDAPIPAGGVILSGHGAGGKRLLELWDRVQSGTAAPQALLRLEATPALRESIGGTPILVRGGTRWFADDGSALVRDRAPRTLAGWDGTGGVMLVTVDGRQDGSAGMTLAEAADLMIGLGANEAINLDGGGSTTFVVRGLVVNQPSDRIVRRNGRDVTVRWSAPGEPVLGYVERAVSDALVLVPAGGGAAAVDPFSTGEVDLPSVLGHAPSATPLPRPSRRADASGLVVTGSAAIALAVRRRSRAVRLAPRNGER